MSHDGSDISDEDAVLPAVGLLDDLDSDVDFSDEDDPALQEYSEADEEWKRRQEEAKGEVEAEGAGGGGGGEQQSDYTVKSAFWNELKTAAAADAGLEAAPRQEQKEAIRRKAIARDEAIMAGKFIACPRFTIHRQGYEFRADATPDSPFGPGYYETAGRALEVVQASPWPAAVGGQLRIGLYKFAK